jgi:hypothetical protein
MLRHGNAIKSVMPFLMSCQRPRNPYRSSVSKGRRFEGHVVPFGGVMSATKYVLIARSTHLLGSASLV